MPSGSGAPRSSPAPLLSHHGWFILDKPPDLSSAGVVAAIKRIARLAGWGRVKVGHGGTLDPLATGVLPVALGEATKLTGRLLDATKAYRFTLAFGAATATDDAEGEVVARSDVRPAREEVEAMLPRFTGEILQRPPAYSALKVDGQRAYALARAGEEVELGQRRVELFALDLIGWGEGWAEFDLACSKGTYVRSFARDLAAALGTVGHVARLRRTRAGPFGEEDALRLDKLEELAHVGRLEQALLPLTAGLDDIPALAVEPGEAALLRQGQRLAGRPDKPGLYLATDGPVPVALVDVSLDAVRVVRGFNL